jgi:hypothetical protein
MRTWTICLLINLLVCYKPFCQYSLTPIITKEKPNSSIKTANKFSFPPLSISKDLIHRTQAFVAPVNTLPKNYYFNSLGFFCKKEFQIEKAFKLPLKIRLGSLSYTDNMEGKGQLFMEVK